MKRAWMPLYVGDYLGDTGHLTTTQHGAYLLLMMHYWRKGDLPDDDEQLSAITKLPLRIWQSHRTLIQAFFYDGWNHKRIDQELAVMKVKTLKRATAGSKGGTQAAINRWRNESSSSNATAKLQQTSSNAIAMLNHSHSPSKKEREEARQGITPSPELLASLNRKASA